jgi:putative membrane protein
MDAGQAPRCTLYAVRATVLAFHLVGVVLWMGGLLTFSRILGYHAREAPSVRPRYTWLEGRMNWLVTVPGFVIAAGTGLWLVQIYGGQWFSQALWMHWKLSLVAVVVLIHAFLTVKQRRVARQRPEEPVPRALFAALHGTLGLLLIAILLLATHQPMKQ